MNAVYISQVYLNFTQIQSQAHQVFVSGKARDQSKRPAWNQQQLSQRTETQARLQHTDTSSTTEVRVTAPPYTRGGGPSRGVFILIISQPFLKLVIPPANRFLFWSSSFLHLPALGWIKLSILRVVFVVVLFQFNPSTLPNALLKHSFQSEESNKTLLGHSNLRAEWCCQVPQDS